MSALAQPIRLAAVAALARSGSNGMSVGEVADAVGGALHNSMSTHLAVLARAGVVKGAKSGRETIYRPNRAAIAELASFIGDLARGEAEQQAEADAE